MLSMPASRLPRQPVGSPALTVRVKKASPEGKNPSQQGFHISVFRIPLTVLGRVDVEMLRFENLRIGRHLRIVHT